MTNQTKHSLLALLESSVLTGASASWLESLYAQYLQNPQGVELKWRNFFDVLPSVSQAGESSSVQPAEKLVEIPAQQVADEFIAYAQKAHKVLDNSVSLLNQATTNQAISNQTSTLQSQSNNSQKQIQVLQLINAYRFRGHQIARVNPIGNRKKSQIDELSLAYHGLGEADLNTVYKTGSLVSAPSLILSRIVQILKKTYCGSVGCEYMHILDTQQKRWLQQQLEGAQGSDDALLSEVEKINILQQLTSAEGLEQYLGARYVGQKRFSLEGAESLIPLLDELVQQAGMHKIKEVVIGMAHRGRLNVLVNILGKTPNELFSEFDGTKKINELTGDVKYHQGFSSDMETAGGPVHLALAFNPSHLEIVAPVVEGSVRARQWRRGDREGKEVMPIQIHGDAAFSGQGVVMETLQMSQSRGYLTHGTVHIIINNQIGFTTSAQQDARSTYYCTDVAKMVGAPIFHVNADDPEALIRVARIALNFRNIFKKDVVVDMVCYRRHGHNEADEPSATQPMMYQKINALASTRKLYAEKITVEKVLTQAQCNIMKKSVRDILESGECNVPHKLPESKADLSTHVNWKPYISDTILTDVDTTVSKETIRWVATKMNFVPADFKLQARVEKIIKDREKMTAGIIDIDWGYAELLAYGTLLRQGYSVRLSGQDSGRGTFFHRHAVLHNQIDGRSYVPLRELGDNDSNFRVFDSLLSELAVLGFEYGFATAEPKTLVLWEAQFGDFANGAQVVVDQFICSGEHKWGRACGLTMLLPHGYEGQGAEHSSARLERFLQLCAVHNMQVCVPSTPAQIFHLLRRQMIRHCRKPLIILTPKSLLRHKLCSSRLQDLTQGKFHWVLPEQDLVTEKKAKRIIICSGKIYYQLLEGRRKNRIDDIIILRIEQLYPFPGKQLDALLVSYQKTNQLVWCQEEPKNQGAWDFIKVRIPALIDTRWQLTYVGREPSSAPAVGSIKLHHIEQQAIINQALCLTEKKT